MSKTKIEKLQREIDNLIAAAGITDAEIRRAQHDMNRISEQRDHAVARAERAENAVAELKQLLHSAECRAARIEGQMSRVREMDAAADRPEVKTTQEIVSHVPPRIDGPFGSDVYPVSGCEERGGLGGKHWTSL